MDLRRRATTLFGILAAAALPPLIAFAVAQAMFGSWFEAQGQGTVLAVAVIGALGWVGLVALLVSRHMVDEARSMVALARRGAVDLSRDGMSPAMLQLAATLEERNRQIAELARQVREAPISTDLSAVARSLVTAARSMTGDPTWQMAITRTDPVRQSLPMGVYGPDAAGEALEEVHRWASTVEAGGRHGVNVSDGPWGAFAIVDVAAGDELRAILLAPWEGRPMPSPAEQDLLALLGQHAATALEHALLYDRLRSQTDELNRLAAAQTDFLRGVTHDLQTPLTSIRALAHELAADESLDQAAKADLAMIAHQADRLRRMVGQLLVVSRLEVGALTPRQEVFKVQPILKRTWEALRADRPFELVESAPETLLVADPDRVEQVLWAVLDNAVRYSPEGSPIRVALGAIQEEACIGSIAVSDQGAGMDAEALEHAFDQFYRSDIARRLSPDGSGLGLHAARGLVRAMGGDISAESQLGGGTTVTITLPAELAEETAQDADGVVLAP